MHIYPVYICIYIIYISIYDIYAYICIYIPSLFSLPSLPHPTPLGHHRAPGRCSTSLIVREMQIKNAMRCHLTVRMASSKNLEAMNAGEGVKKRKPTGTVSRNVNWYSHHAEQHDELGLLSHGQLWDPTDCSPAGSSLHGILQARILVPVAISSSRGSSQPRDWTRGLRCLLHCRWSLYPPSHVGM